MFTNPSEEDFTDKWNNIEYTFPAGKTSPMIISGEAPEAVQHIRKKFAKNLALREFFKSSRYKELSAMVGLGSFNEDNELTEYIQRCLNELPIEPAKTKVLPRDSEKNYKSKAVGAKSNLVKEFEDESTDL